MNSKEFDNTRESLRNMLNGVKNFSNSPTYNRDLIPLTKMMIYLADRLVDEDVDKSRWKQMNKNAPPISEKERIFDVLENWSRGSVYDVRTHALPIREICKAILMLEEAVIRMGKEETKMEQKPEQWKDIEPVKETPMTQWEEVKRRIRDVMGGRSTPANNLMTLFEALWFMIHRVDHLEEQLNEFSPEKEEGKDNVKPVTEELTSAVTSSNHRDEIVRIDMMLCWASQLVNNSRLGSSLEKDQQDELISIYNQIIRLRNKMLEREGISY